MKCLLCFLFICLLCKTCFAGYSSSSGGGSAVPKKYRVTTLIDPPFVEAPDDEGKYSGVVVQILDEFKRLGNFDYVLSETQDGVAGDSYPNGSSNGLIHDVVSGQADIAATDLVQTYTRTLVVDFSQPFRIDQYRIAVNKNYNATTAKYITINSTAVQSSLEKNTVNPLTRAIWASIKAGLPDSIVTSYAEGVQRVANGGNIAFVGSTPGLTIEVAKRADKVSVTGDNLAYAGLAFAVKIDSPLRRLLDDKLVFIQENGTLGKILSVLPRGCLS